MYCSVFYPVNSSTLSDSLSRKRSCTPVHLEMYLITQDFFRNRTYIFAEDMEEGYEPTANASPCRKFNRAFSIITINKLKQIATKTKRNINPLSSKHQYMYNGTIKRFRDHFVPAIGKINPTAKIYYSAVFEKQADLEEAFRFAWQKYNMMNAIVSNFVGGPTVLVNFCAFNPFHGSNGQFFCSQNESISISYAEVKDFLSKRHKNLNDYKIKVFFLHLRKKNKVIVTI